MMQPKKETNRFPFPSTCRKACMLLLACGLACGICTPIVSAQETTTQTTQQEVDEITFDGITYLISEDDTLLCHRISSDFVHLVIPAAVTYENKTYPVTKIDSYAFQDSKAITSISLPNTITKIGAYLIHDSTQLQTFELYPQPANYGMYFETFWNMENTNIIFHTNAKYKTQAEKLAHNIATYYNYPDANFTLLTSSVTNTQLQEERTITGYSATFTFTCVIEPGDALQFTYIYRDNPVIFDSLTTSGTYTYTMQIDAADIKENKPISLYIRDSEGTSYYTNEITIPSLPSTEPETPTVPEPPKQPDTPIVLDKQETSPITDTAATQAETMPLLLILGGSILALCTIRKKANQI